MAGAWEAYCGGSNCFSCEGQCQGVTYILACADISLLNLALSFSGEFKRMNHAWLPLKGKEMTAGCEGEYLQSLE